MKRKFRCVAIDDQPHAISAIQKLIRSHPDLVLIKSFTSSLKALAGIKKSDNIDVIFMDIEMPDLDGIELAKTVRDKTVHLVFITAFDKYALKSFEASPDQFLLKPLSSLAFIQTISSLRSRSNATIQVESKIDDHLFFPTDIRGIAEMVCREDVIMFEPSTGSNNTKVYTETKIYEVRITLAKIELYLEGDFRFMRISRSCIINVDHIVRLGAGKVEMGSKDRKRMSIGADYAEVFNDYLSQRLLSKLG